MAGWICSSFLLAGMARAQTSAPITFSIDAWAQGNAISSNFSGISFETGSERLGNAGTSGYMFSATNTQLITLFQNIAFKNIRVGGGSVDDETPPGFGSDGVTGVNNLFAFAGQAGVSVIYSLRLLGSSSMNYQTESADIADYIWANYQPQIDFFCIGNEPNWNSYHYPPAGTGPDPRIVYYDTSLAHEGYVEEWNEFADAVSAMAPGAPFGGPDTGDENGATATWFDGESWTQNFINDATAGNITGPVLAATQHNYIGGDDTGLSVAAAISNMLSAAWVTADYPQLYNQTTGTVAAAGLAYRMTECNPYTGGLVGADNAFASALWALDYMHWQAARSPYCQGVNFHNKQWLATDTIYLDAHGNYQANPKACGIKAFDLGSHGNVLANTSFSNPNGINVTGYAVGDAANLYITIINKTGGGTPAVNANVTIAPANFSASYGEYIVLNGAPVNNPSALGATLGGAPITNNAPWQGTWTALRVSASGQCTLAVNSASAAIIHITGSPVPPVPMLQSPQINSDGIFSFTLVGAAGYSYTIQGSTDLVNWNPLETVNNETGSIEIVIRNPPQSQSGYYYRAVLLQ